ncbi:MAG TPA: cupin domain-containing protein [Burkholderiales bacterium]|nr:cupin domain-containing protein [Burkholderiales bacterium]
MLTQGQAKNLGLPGRKSLEIVSGEKGSRAVTLRLVEIAVPQPGDKPRGRHFHSDTEECIYVLAGEGRTESDSGEHALRAGDTLLIPAGEAHVTRNTGGEPLVLLCFFPVCQVVNRDASK